MNQPTPNLPENYIDFSTKFNLLTLGGSFVTFFYCLSGAVITLGISYLSQNFGIKQWFLSQPLWINLTIASCIIFLVMTVIISWVDSFIVDMYNFLVDKLGKIALSILSTTTLLVLLVCLYFILPEFLVVIRDNFWL